MSDRVVVGPYVYQTHGMQDREHWASGRIYALGGLPPLAKIDGLMKSEAEAVLAAFTGRIREQIAANVEGLGCNCDCWSLEAMRGQESLEIGGSRHWHSCPVAVAFAIRGGRL